MTRWRALVLLVVGGSVLAGLISVLAFESAGLGHPGLPRHFIPRRSAWLASGGDGTLLNIAAWLAGMLSQYLLGVLVLFVAPRRIRTLADALSGSGRRLGFYLLVGVSLAVALLAVGLLSTLTVHTFPLPFILIGLFFLSALAGTVALTYQLGTALARRAEWGGGSPLIHLAVGTLVLFSVSRVPFLGILVTALVWLTGAGAAVTTRLGSGRVWTLTPLVEESV